MNTRATKAPPPTVRATEIEPVPLLNVVLF
jgi:hypothetical protein